MARRRIVVHIGISADGFIARPDGDLEWLTNRPAPKGFYGMSAFMKSLTVVPVFIGDGFPLIAPRHRHVPLRLISSERFPDGVVQLHYGVAKRPA